MLAYNLYYRQSFPNSCKWCCNLCAFFYLSLPWFSVHFRHTKLPNFCVLILLKSWSDLWIFLGGAFTCWNKGLTTELHHLASIWYCSEIPRGLQNSGDYLFQINNYQTWMFKKKNNFKSRPVNPPIFSVIPLYSTCLSCCSSVQLFSWKSPIFLTFFNKNKTKRFTVTLTGGIT